MSTLIGTIKATSKLAKGKKSGKAWERKTMYVAEESDQANPKVWTISVLNAGIKHIPKTGAKVAIEYDSAMYNERPQYTAVYITELE